MNTTDDDFEDVMEKLDEMLDAFLNITEDDYLEQVVLKYDTFSKIPPYYLLLLETIIHSCICAFGYLGNIVTCIVIASDKSMRTTTNIYLFNLAVVDLILLTSGLVNYTIASWFPYKNYKIGVFSQKFGMKGCFFFNWVSDLGVNVSIMTITAFTIERYLAICRPFLARMTLTIPKAFRFIFLIWIIGAVFGYLVYSQRELYYMENETTPVCYFPEDTIRYIAEAESLLFFVLPFALITVLYTLIWKQLVASCQIQKNQGTRNIESSRPEIQSDDRNNKQIMKMLEIHFREFATFLDGCHFGIYWLEIMPIIWLTTYWGMFFCNVTVAVVAVFFFVWAPYHCGRLLMLHLTDLFFIFIENFNDIDLLLESIYVIVYFLSSAVNPVIYSIMSKKFRRAFQKLFKCWNICYKKEPSKSNSSHSRERSTTETGV